MILLNSTRVFAYHPSPSCHKELRDQRAACADMPFSGYPITHMKLLLYFDQQYRHSLAGLAHLRYAVLLLHIAESMTLVNFTM